VYATTSDQQREALIMVLMFYDKAIAFVYIRGGFHKAIYALRLKFALWAYPF
jgi:hypothetical protein